MADNRAALVIGGGVAGIRAGLDLAEAGVRVYLCDRSPSIGGSALQSDRWFPDNHCGMCQMLPSFNRDVTPRTCLRRGLTHPDIEVLPLTGVESVQGQAGAFRVALRTQPRGVDTERCIGCGACVEVCPAGVADGFQGGLAYRKAIHLPHPLQPSNQYAIDWEACIRCGACVVKCPTQAINLSLPPHERTLEVGAIVLAAGFEAFDARPLTHYGFGRYPNVITNIQLERMLSGSGPYGGLARPSGGNLPKSVAFLQCAGSRDTKRGYCSAACCMYALKEATLIRQAYPGVDVRIFFMDMRAFGKGYHRYYEEAGRRWGVGFTRCRVPVVKQDFRTSELLISAPSAGGAPEMHRFDMVVLSTGQAPSPGFKQLCGRLGVETDGWGFCRTKPFAPAETSRDGIFVCGPASGPEDIADSLCEAGAAAGAALRMLGASHGRPPLPAVPPHPGEDGETRIAVILCKCEEAPDAVLDASALTDVSTVHTIPYLCLPDGFEQAKRLLAQSDANRVVVAACSHFSNGKLARLAGESNLPTACVQGVNLREEVAWVHGDVPGAGRKAGALVAMAVERLRLQQTPRSLDAPVTPAALVVGGGVAGLTAALSLADLGYETHLVERTDLLGGNLREVYATLNSGDPQALLRDLMAHAGRSDSLHIHTGAELCVVEGRAGEFRVTIRRKDGAAQMVQVGAIIVATGGHENRPSEYLYGQSEQVLTQRELERLLARNEPRVAGLRSVVMIQCVGSRDERHRYCSRICCTQALKNALEVKARNPDAQVVVLYRDLMSYAFHEERYTEAREKGVLFVRYEPDGKPRVSAEGDRLRVEFAEPALGETVTLSPDLLVLSAGAVPDAPRDLAAMLGVELDADGFVEEAEEKFRPVETLRDGVFVCGLAHSPRDISETVAQARAAAQRAASLLAHARLQSGWAVATVNARRCSGCEVCIEVCPYNAREKDEEERVVVVRDMLCRGCGACAAACPNGAAQLGGFSERQVFAMMDKV